MAKSPNRKPYGNVGEIMKGAKKPPSGKKATAKPSGKLPGLARGVKDIMNSVGGGKLATAKPVKPKKKGEGTSTIQKPKIKLKKGTKLQ